MSNKNIKINLPKNTIYYDNKENRILYNVDFNIKSFQLTLTSFTDKKLYKNTNKPIAKISTKIKNNYKNKIFSTEHINKGINNNRTKNNFINRIDEFDIITNDYDILGTSFSGLLIPKGKGFLTNNLGTHFDVTRIDRIIFVDEFDKIQNVSYWEESIPSEYQTCTVGHYSITNELFSRDFTLGGNISTNGNIWQHGGMHYFVPENVFSSCSDFTTLTDESLWGDITPNEVALFYQHSYWTDIINDITQSPGNVPFESINYDVNPLVNLTDKLGEPIYTIYPKNAGITGALSLDEITGNLTDDSTPITFEFELWIKATQLDDYFLTGSVDSVYICRYNEPQMNTWGNYQPNHWFEIVNDGTEDGYLYPYDDYRFAPRYFNNDDEPIDNLPPSQYQRTVGLCTGFADPNCVNCTDIRAVNIADSPFSKIVGFELNWNPKHFTDSTETETGYSGFGLMAFIESLSVDDTLNPWDTESYTELGDNAPYTQITNTLHTSNFTGGMAVQATPSFSTEENSEAVTLQNLGQNTWDWNPLTQCYGLINHNNDWSASYNDHGEVLKFLGFDIMSTSVEYDNINESADGLKLFNFRFTIPTLEASGNTVEQLLQLDEESNKEKFVNFLNSFGCYQTNNLVGFNINAPSYHYNNKQQSIYFKYEPITENDISTDFSSVTGCTDTTAWNCTSEQCCTTIADVLMWNYPLCTSTSSNYYATDDDGSCVERVVGCMDSEAYNYNPLANVEEPDSCRYTLPCNCTGEIKFGDVNCDGVVNQSDINLVINAMLNDTFDELFCPAAADVTGNGILDIYDINIIQQCLIYQNADSYPDIDLFSGTTLEELCNTTILANSQERWSTNLTIMSNNSDDWQAEVPTKTISLLTPEEYYEISDGGTSEELVDANIIGGSLGPIGGSNTIDSSTFEYQIVTSPILGEIISIDSDNRTLEYKANPNMIGQDSFSYNIVQTFGITEYSLFNHVGTGLGFPPYYAYYNVFIDLVPYSETPTFNPPTSLDIQVDLAQIIDIPVSVFYPFIVDYDDTDLSLFEFEVQKHTSDYTSSDSYVDIVNDDTTNGIEVIRFASSHSLPNSNQDQLLIRVKDKNNIYSNWTIFKINYRTTTNETRNVPRTQTLQVNEDGELNFTLTIDHLQTQISSGCELPDNTIMFLPSDSNHDLPRVIYNFTQYVSGFNIDILGVNWSNILQLGGDLQTDTAVGNHFNNSQCIAHQSEIMCTAPPPSPMGIPVGCGTLVNIYGYDGENDIDSTDTDLSILPPIPSGLSITAFLGLDDSATINIQNITTSEDLQGVVPPADISEFKIRGTENIYGWDSNQQNPFTYTIPWLDTDWLDYSSFNLSYTSKIYTRSGGTLEFNGEEINNSDEYCLNYNTCPQLKIPVIYKPYSNFYGTDIIYLKSEDSGDYSNIFIDILPTIEQVEPRYNISFRPSKEMETYEQVADFINIPLVETSIGLNTYGNDSNGDFNPIRFPINSSTTSINLLDVSSLLGYDFEIIQTTPNPDNYNLITNFIIEYYGEGGLLDTEEIDLSNNDLTASFKIGSFRLKNNRPGLFFDEFFPNPENNYEFRDVVLNDRRWNITHIVLKPISRTSDLGIAEEYSTKTIRFNKENYVSQREHDKGLRPLPPQFLQGGPIFQNIENSQFQDVEYLWHIFEDNGYEQSSYNIIVDVKRFTSLKNVHTQLSIVRQPDNGIVIVGDSGIGCVSCRDRVPDKFYLRYIPNTNWNSSEELNTRHLLDTFDIRVDELLYENTTGNFSIYGDRVKLLDYFNDVYVYLQCIREWDNTESWDIDGSLGGSGYNPTCSESNPILVNNTFSDFFNFNFIQQALSSTDNSENNYNVVYQNTINYISPQSADFYVDTFYNNSHGEESYSNNFKFVKDNFIKTFSVNVLPQSDSPIITNPVGFPIEVNETSSGTTSIFNLREIFNFPDYNTDNLYSVSYGIDILNANEISENIDYWLGDSILFSDLYSSLSIIPEFSPSQEPIVFNIKNQDEELELIIPPFTNSLPNIGFQIKAIIHDNGIPLQYAQLPSFIKIQNELLIPFDTLEFKNNFIRKTNREDFIPFNLNFEDPLYYSGDIGGILNSQLLKDWSLNLNDGATANVIEVDNSPTAVDMLILVHGNSLDDIDFHSTAYEIEIIQRQIYVVTFTTTIENGDGRRIKIQLVDNSVPTSVGNNRHLGLDEIVVLQNGTHTHELLFEASNDIVGINPSSSIRMLFGREEGFTEPINFNISNHITIDDIAIRRVDPNLINVSSFRADGITIETTSNPLSYRISPIPEYYGPVSIDYTLQWMDRGMPPTHEETLLIENNHFHYQIFFVYDHIIMNIVHNQIYSLNQGFGNNVIQLTGTNPDGATHSPRIEYVGNNGEAILENVSLIVNDYGLDDIGNINMTININEISSVASDAFQTYREEFYNLILETNYANQSYTYTYPFTIRVNPVNSAPDIKATGNISTTINPSLDYYIEENILSYGIDTARFIIPNWEARIMRFDGHIKVKDEYTSADNLTVEFIQTPFAPSSPGIYTFNNIPDGTFPYSDASTGPLLVSYSWGDSLDDEYTLLNIEAEINPLYNPDRELDGTSYLAEIEIKIFDDGINDNNNILSSSKKIYFQIGDFPGCQNQGALNYDKYAALDCSNITGLCELSPGSQQFHQGITPTIYTLDGVEAVSVDSQVTDASSLDVSPNNKSIKSIRTLSVENNIDNFGFMSNILDEAPADSGYIQNLRNDEDCIEHDSTECDSYHGCRYYNSGCVAETDITIGYWSKLKKPLVIETEESTINYPEGGIEICYKAGEINLHRCIRNPFLTNIDYTDIPLTDFDGECNNQNIEGQCGPVLSEYLTGNQPISDLTDEQLNTQVGICEEFTQTLDSSCEKINWKQFLGQHWNSNNNNNNPYDVANINQWIWVQATIPIGGWNNEFPKTPDYIKSWNISTNNQTNLEANLYISELVVQQSSDIIGGGIVCNDYPKEYCGDTSDEYLSLPSVINGINYFQNACTWVDIENIAGGYSDESCCFFFDFNVELQTGYDVTQNCIDPNIWGAGTSLGIHSIYTINYDGAPAFGGDCDISSSSIAEYTMVNGGRVNLYINAQNKEISNDFIPNNFKLIPGGYQCTETDMAMDSHPCAQEALGFNDTYPEIFYMELFYYIYYPFGNFEQIIVDFENVSNYTTTTNGLYNSNVDTPQFNQDGVNSGEPTYYFNNDAYWHNGDNTYDSDNCGGECQFTDDDGTFIEYGCWCVSTELGNKTLPDFIWDNVTKPSSEIITGLTIILKNYLEKAQAIHVCTQEDVDNIPECLEEGDRILTDEAVNLYRMIEADSSIGATPYASIADIGNPEYYDDIKGRNFSEVYFNSKYTKSIKYSDIINNLSDTELGKYGSALERAIKYIYYYPSTLSNLGDYIQYEPCTEDNLFDGSNPKEECFTAYEGTETTDTATGAYLQFSDNADTDGREVVCKTPPLNLSGIYEHDGYTDALYAAPNEFETGIWKSIPQRLVDAMGGEPDDSATVVPHYSFMLAENDGGINTMNGNNKEPIEAGIVCCALQDYIATQNPNTSSGYQGWNDFIETIIGLEETFEDSGTPTDMTHFPAPTQKYGYIATTTENILGTRVMSTTTHPYVAVPPAWATDNGAGLHTANTNRIKMPIEYGESSQLLVPQEHYEQEYSYEYCANFGNQTSSQSIWCHFIQFRFNWWFYADSPAELSADSTHRWSDISDNPLSVCRLQEDALCPRVHIGAEWIRFHDNVSENNNKINLPIDRDISPGFPANLTFAHDRSEGNNGYAHSGLEFVEIYDLSFGNSMYPALARAMHYDFPSGTFTNYPALHVHQSDISSSLAAKSYVTIGQCINKTIPVSGDWPNRIHEDMEFNYYDIIKWIQGFLKQDVQVILESQLDGTDITDAQATTLYNRTSVLDPVINDMHKLLAVSGFDYFALPHDTKHGHMIKPEVTLLKHQAVEVESTTGVCESNVDYECTEDDVNTCSETEAASSDLSQDGVYIETIITRVCLGTDISCNTDADCSQLGCSEVGEIVSIIDISNPMNGQECPVLEENAPCPHYTHSCQYTDYFCADNTGAPIELSNGSYFVGGCNLSHVGNACPEQTDLLGTTCIEHITNEPSNFCGNYDEGNFIDDVPCGTDTEFGIITQEECCVDKGGGTLTNTFVHTCSFSDYLSNNNGCNDECSFSDFQFFFFGSADCVIDVPLPNGQAFCSDADTTWYGVSSPDNLGYCGDGTPDGVCSREEDITSVCKVSTSMDYVPSINANPIDSEEEAINSCLTYELDFGNSDSCYIIGTLGGISADKKIDYLNDGFLPDLNIESENFGYLSQNTDSNLDTSAVHRHPQINIIDTINITNKPDVSMDYYSALFDGFGTYEDNLPPGAVQGAWSWINLLDRVEFNDYISLDLPINYPTYSDMVNQNSSTDIIFDSERYYSQGLRYLNFEGNAISFEFSEDNTVELDLNKHTPFTLDGTPYIPTLSNFENVNLITSFQSGLDVSGEDGSGVDKYTFSQLAEGVGNVNLKFKANPLYFDNNIEYIVKDNFDINVLPNRGPIGSTFSYIKPTFGNNPNNLKIHLSGNDDIRTGNEANNSIEINNLWEWPVKRGLIYNTEGFYEPFENETNHIPILNTLSSKDYQILLEDPRAKDENINSLSYNPEGYVVYNISYDDGASVTHDFATVTTLDTITNTEEGSGLSHIYNDNGNFHYKVRALAPLSNFQFIDEYPFLEWCISEGDNQGNCYPIDSGNVPTWVKDIDLDVDIYGMTEDRYEIAIFNVITIQQSIGGEEPYKYYNPYRGIRISVKGAMGDNSLMCGTNTISNTIFPLNFPNGHNNEIYDARLSYDMRIFEICNADTRATLGVFTPAYDINGNLVNCTSGGEGGHCDNDYENHIATKDDTFNLKVPINQQGAAESDYKLIFGTRSELTTGDTGGELFTIDADIRPEASNIQALDATKLPESTMKYWDEKYDRDTYYFNAAPVGLRMFLYTRTFEEAQSITTPAGYNEAYDIDHEYTLDNSPYEYLGNIFANRTPIDFDNIITSLTNFESSPTIDGTCVDAEGSVLTDCYDTTYSGLYVCDLDWGDGSEKENPCEDFWSLKLKESYNDYKLTDEKLLYHTYLDGGIFNIRGVVFPMVTPFNANTAGLNQDPPGEPSLESTISSTRMFIATINVNSGRNDADFEFLGGNIDNPLLPLGEPFNNENTVPIIGGFSKNSLYYKYITSYLGYKPDSSQFLETKSPIVNNIYTRLGEKINMSEQASLMDADLKFSLYGGSINEYGSGNDLLTWNGINTITGNTNSFTGSIAGDTRAQQLDTAIVPFNIVNKIGNEIDFTSDGDGYEMRAQGFWDYRVSDITDDLCSGLSTYASFGECEAIIFNTTCIDSLDWEIDDYYCEPEAPESPDDSGRCRVSCKGSEGDDIQFYPTINGEYSLIDNNDSCNQDSECFALAEEFCKCMDLSGYNTTNPNNIWLWDTENGQCITLPPEGEPPIESAQDLEVYSGCYDDEADNTLPERFHNYKSVCSECVYSNSLEQECDSYKQEIAPYGSDGICEFTSDGCRPRGYLCNTIFNDSGECRDDCNWLFSEESTGGFEYDPIYGLVDEKNTNFAILINSGKYKRRGELGEYPGEMDFQSTKFNLGIEPLYKHFIGDKNCDMNDSKYIGTITKNNCGSDCQIICYNSNTSQIVNYYNPITQTMEEFINDKTEYYLADSVYQCLAVGNSPVQCVGVKTDGCYVPLLGLNHDDCCQFSSGTTFDNIYDDNTNALSEMNLQCEYIRAENFNIEGNAEIECNSQPACFWSNNTCHVDTDLLRTDCTTRITEGDCLQSNCFWDGTQCTGTIWLGHLTTDDLILESMQPVETEFEGERGRPSCTLPPYYSDCTNPANAQCPISIFGYTATFCAPAGGGVANVNICHECLYPGVYEGQEEPGFCNPTQPYCSTNDCLANPNFENCGTQLVCSECDEIGLQKGIYDINDDGLKSCVKRYALGIDSDLGYQGNMECLPDEFGCPEDLTCKVKCSCVVDETLETNKKTCNTVSIGCTDPTALNYKPSADCQAPYGIIGECIYYDCTGVEDTKTIYNCNENLNCKCLTEHIYTASGKISPAGTPSTFSADFIAELGEHGFNEMGQNVEDIIQIDCPKTFENYLTGDLKITNCYGLPVIPIAEEVYNMETAMCGEEGCKSEDGAWTPNLNFKYGNFGSKTGIYDSIVDTLANWQRVCTQEDVDNYIDNCSYEGEPSYKWSLLTHPHLYDPNGEYIGGTWPSQNEPECTGTCGIKAIIPQVELTNDYTYNQLIGDTEVEVEYNLCATGTMCCPVTHWIRLTDKKNGAVLSGLTSDIQPMCTSQCIPLSKTINGMCPDMTTWLLNYEENYKPANNITRESIFAGTEEKICTLATADGTPQTCDTDDECINYDGMCADYSAYCTVGSTDCGNDSDGVPVSCTSSSELEITIPVNECAYGSNVCTEAGGAADQDLIASDFCNQYNMEISDYTLPIVDTFGNVDANQKRPNVEFVSPSFFLEGNQNTDNVIANYENWLENYISNYTGAPTPLNHVFGLSTDVEGTYDIKNLAMMCHQNYATQNAVSDSQLPSGIQDSTENPNPCVLVSNQTECEAIEECSFLFNYGHDTAAGGECHRTTDVNTIIRRPWPQILRNNISDYSGHCPSRWWCSTENKGHMFNASYGQSHLEADPLSTDYFNFYTQAFNEHAECHNAKYPIVDTHNLCNDEYDESGSHTGEGCLECTEGCQSEIEMWALYSGLTGNAGFLPRRIFNPTGCCECPCFCAPPDVDKKLGKVVQPRTSMGVDASNDFYNNATSADDQPWYLVDEADYGEMPPMQNSDGMAVSCGNMGTGDVVNNNIYDESGGLSPWILNIYDFCVNDAIHENGETLYPSPMCEEFLENMPPRPSADGDPPPCNQGDSTNTDCDNCNMEIPFAMLPSEGGIVCPSEPSTGTSFFTLSPAELGIGTLSVSSEMCFDIQPATALNQYLLVSHQSFTSLQSQAYSLCQQGSISGYEYICIDSFITDIFDDLHPGVGTEYVPGMGNSGFGTSCFCWSIYWNLGATHTDGTTTTYGDDIISGELNHHHNPTAAMHEWYLWCNTLSASAYNVSTTQYSNYTSNNTCDDCNEDDLISTTVNLSVFGNQWGQETYTYTQPAGTNCWGVEIDNCSPVNGCIWNEDFQSCEPENPSCSPPPLPDSLPFSVGCAGAGACTNPKACVNWCASNGGGGGHGSGGTGDGGGTGGGGGGGGTGGDGTGGGGYWLTGNYGGHTGGYWRFSGRGDWPINYGLCRDTPYWVVGNDFWHRDNPDSPFYWRNIIPENYDLLNRFGVSSNDGNITNVDLASNQEYTNSWNFTENSKDTCFTYPVLPKFNTQGEYDASAGLQTIDYVYTKIVIPESRDVPYPQILSCRTTKIPFLGRNYIINGLNSKECSGSLEISGISPSVYFDIGWNWENYDSCDIVHDNTLYDGLINIDFTEIIENQVLNCINSDCIGFVLGDYKVDVDRVYNKVTKKREYVVNKNKLTKPVLPKAITKDDGVF